MVLTLTRAMLVALPFAALTTVSPVIAGPSQHFQQTKSFISQSRISQPSMVRGTTEFSSSKRIHRYKKVQYHVARRSRTAHRVVHAAPANPAVSPEMASLIGDRQITVASAPEAKSSTPRARRGALAARASVEPISTSSSSSLSGGGLIAEARRFLGTNPTGQAALWCAAFMNMILQRTGHETTGSNMARSFASYGRRVSGPRVGAIAVMSRGKRGGHVGVVTGIDAKGNPIVISGNYNRRVAEAAIPRGRIYAYVMPGE